MHALTTRLLTGGWTVLAAPAVPVITSVVLVIAIAWMVASLSFQILPDPTPKPDSTIRTATQRSTDNIAPSANIASLNLFGKASPDQSSSGLSTPPANAPETRLDLRLTGLFAAGDGQGLAIIIPGNEEETVFGVGDRIAGQARVEGIYADRVILRRDGELEILHLIEDDVSTTGIETASPNDAGNHDIRHIARKVRELRERWLRDPSEISRTVHFQPYMRDGELIGYRIQPRNASTGLLDEVGLRATDVITKVNGTSLEDPGRVRNVLQQARTAETISITWLREGRQHRMTIPIESDS